MTWRRPQAGVVKINVDAAVSKAMSTVGIGVIARDEFGLILGILVKTYEGLTSPQIAEALAIRDGLNMGYIEVVEIYNMNNFDHCLGPGMCPQNTN